MVQWQAPNGSAGAGTGDADGREMDDGSLEAEDVGLSGFLFGNVDRRGRLEADYLDRDAKAHLRYVVHQVALPESDADGDALTVADEFTAELRRQRERQLETDGTAASDSDSDRANGGRAAAVMESRQLDSDELGRKSAQAPAARRGRHKEEGRGAAAADYYDETEIFDDDLSEGERERLAQIAVAGRASVPEAETQAQWPLQQRQQPPLEDEYDEIGGEAAVAPPPATTTTTPAAPNTGSIPFILPPVTETGLVRFTRFLVPEQRRLPLHLHGRRRIVWRSKAEDGDKGVDGLELEEESEFQRPDDGVLGQYPYARLVLQDWEDALQVVALRGGDRRRWRQRQRAARTPETSAPVPWTRSSPPERPPLAPLSADGWRAPASTAVADIRNNALCEQVEWEEDIHWDDNIDGDRQRHPYPTPTERLLQDFHRNALLDVGHWIASIRFDDDDDGVPPAERTAVDVAAVTARPHRAAAGAPPQRCPPAAARTAQLAAQDVDGPVADIAQRSGRDISVRVPAGASAATGTPTGHGRAPVAVHATRPGGRRPRAGRFAPGRTGFGRTAAAQLRRCARRAHRDGVRVDLFRGPGGRARRPEHRFFGGVHRARHRPRDRHRPAGGSGMSGAAQQTQSDDTQQRPHETLCEALYRAASTARGGSARRARRRAHRARAALSAAAGVPGDGHLQRAARGMRQRAQSVRRPPPLCRRGVAAARSGPVALDHPRGDVRVRVDGGRLGGAVRARYHHLLQPVHAGQYCGRGRKGRTGRARPRHRPVHACRAGQDALGASRRVGTRAESAAVRATQRAPFGRAGDGYLARGGHRGRPAAHHDARRRAALSAAAVCLHAQCRTAGSAGAAGAAGASVEADRAGSGATTTADPAVSADSATDRSALADHGRDVAGKAAAAVARRVPGGERGQSGCCCRWSAQWARWRGRRGRGAARAAAAVARG
eukprot:ctg_218.g144